MKKQERRTFLRDTFKNRYTCKGYDPQKRVSDEDFNTIMEVARLSPSSMGLEPWKFVLLNNQDLRNKIRPYSWGAEVSLDGASHFVLILARKAADLKADSAYIEYIMNDVQHFTDDLRGKRKKKLNDFQQKDLKLTNDRAIFDWACKQAYIALANMLTAAAMLEVDSTPIEGFNTEKVESVLIEEKILDPDHFGLCVMVAFGYANRDHRPKTRRKTNEILDVID